MSEPQAPAKAENSAAATPAQPSNKELKELKKKEKAAKRAAQKEALGISHDEQKQMAQLKMDKKKQQATNNTY